MYGLGALLYEVLTGARPHEDTASGANVQASAPEAGAPRGRADAAVAGGLAGRGSLVRGGGLARGRGLARGAAPRSQRAAGDLDTICLKALHQDPARRYGSASELAGDLERYLEGRPVEARRDSLAYVAGRFARRHRAAVGAGVAALLAFVAGLAFSLVSLAGERAARAEAEASEARATEAADLLAGMFQTASPDYDDGREMTTREALAEGVQRVGRVESPRLQAYLLRVLAETYIQIGDPQTADSLLQVSLDLIGRDVSSEEASRVRALLMPTRDALADPEGVVALAERLYRDHRDDDSGRALGALWWLSRAQSGLGEHRSAIAMAERYRAMLPPEASDGQRAEAASLLGGALFSAGRVEASIAPLSEALDLTVSEVGRRDGRTVRALVALGRARGHLGQIEEAEPLLREAIAFATERYGADRVDYPLAYLGEAKLHAGQFREAAAVLDSALAVGTVNLPPDHPALADWHALRAEASNGYGSPNPSVR